MTLFVQKHLASKQHLKILDVGSYNVNGCYKPLFEKPGWDYIGLDIEPGKNVDLVGEPYDWKVDKDSFDVVISGQCLEHVKDTHKWIRQLAQALKPGGLACVIAPWSFNEHRYPVDCWRILPDGMRFLLHDIGKLEVIEVFKCERDCVGIATK